MRLHNYGCSTNRDAISIGYAGVYSTFLLHARRAGERYGIDPRDILTELGRRQAVAGQEDWILDVALELARDGQTHPPLRPEILRFAQDDITGCHPERSEGSALSDAAIEFEPLH
jgi:DmpG-like protein